MPFVFDLEGDALRPTKIHCLCYYDLTTKQSVALTDYDDMRAFVEQADVLIGHNITRFDIPVLERLLGVKIKSALVDTLPLSWYLHPETKIHGLEEWGEILGIAKPEILDWANQSLETYIHRCSEDVKINTKLWIKFRKHLIRIYGDWDKAKPLIAYLAFKMNCAREQERSKWRLDKAYALESLKKLTEAKEAKQATLIAIMPKKPLYALRKRPAKPFKKDGTYSTAGSRWFNLLEHNGLPSNHVDPIQEKIGEQLGNPGSPLQIKEWLYSLGWKPDEFKYTRDKETGELKTTPLVNKELAKGGGLSQSVLNLIADNPDLSALDALGTITNRIATINGFLKFCGDGEFVQAQVAGITNTMRFKHKVCVNLPKVNRLYGEEIRGCLIARDGYELCGSDMSSLEDRLKQHFIYPYDPKYVEQMNKADWDPHLDLALTAGEITEEQCNDYKAGISKAIKPIRDIFKNGNYACQYGAGPPRLALTANIPLAKAKQVWEAYWAKNWAIKKAAEDCIIKTVSGQMWLFNPISQLWYSLRFEKDAFSTLVQGSAAFVFDEWVRYFRLSRSQLTAQFHDEVVLEVKVGHRKEAEKLLLDAIEKLNSTLKLNRRLDVEVQFGNRYSEIH